MDYQKWLDTRKTKRYTEFKLDRLVKHHHKDFQTYCIDSDEYKGRTFVLTLERPDDFDPMQVRANYIDGVSDTWNEFCRVVTPNHIEMLISLNDPDDAKNREFFDLVYFPKK